jgi:hypothetical protein
VEGVSEPIDSNDDDVSESNHGVYKSDADDMSQMTDSDGECDEGAAILLSFTDE